MVHLETEDVISYLGEIVRVLTPCGRAVLHYSNMDKQPGGCYRDAPHCRNFFCEPMMLHFAQRKGPKTLRHMTMDWGKDPVFQALDALILMEKPEPC